MQYQILDWDTNFFGVTVARINEPVLNELKLSDILFELKILQEVITLSIFVPFSLFYLKEPLKLDYLWAAICVLLAVFFVFRGKLSGG